MKQRATELPEEDWAFLDGKAAGLNCMHGDRPSWTKLLKRICNGELEITEVKQAEPEKPVDESGDSGCRWKDGSVVTNKQLAEFKANNYNYGKGFTPDAYVSDGYKK